MQYNFKDKYYGIKGEPLAESRLSFISLLGRKNGTQARLDPLYTQSINISTNSTNVYVLSGGYHNMRVGVGSGGNDSQIVGQGIYSTILNINPYSFGQFGTIKAVDLSMKINISGIIDGGFNVAGVRIFDSVITAGRSYELIMNKCIIDNTTVVQTGGTLTSISLLNCTVDNKILLGSGNLLNNCKVVIDQSIINTFRNNYLAFDNCLFRIGSEDDFLPLSGSAEADLRQNFVDRCTAQGLTVPTGSEYSEVNIPVYRWVFDNNGSTGGHVVKGSIIHNFTMRRLVTVGYSDIIIEKLPVTPDLTIPASISGDNKSDNLIVEPNAIHFDESVSITERFSSYIDSKIIWLGGSKQISFVEIVNDLLSEYGVMPDSTWSLKELTGNIQPNINYLIRSNNDGLATVTYNGVNYTSALNSRDNVFRGIESVIDYNASENAVIYEIVDIAIFKTMQMRIVNDLPAQKITSGNLQPGYWYFIAPNDLNDTSGTIKYKGIDYPCYSSFIASDTSSIAINGQCHLRRCWHKDFNFDTESTDKSFWQNIQKPKWVDIIPDDLRCLKKNNSEYSIEMAEKDGVYIASGHPDFYNSITGASGIVAPAFNITGSFMQFRLSISTLNPM